MPQTFSTCGLSESFLISNQNSLVRTLSNRTDCRTRIRRSSYEEFTNQIGLDTIRSFTSRCLLSHSRRLDESSSQTDTWLLYSDIQTRMPGDGSLVPSKRLAS